MNITVEFLQSGCWHSRNPDTSAVGQDDVQLDYRNTFQLKTHD